ncbi:polysaccharide deacetylase family protein [Tropicimonas aquimaris]|uniref:Chitooligosaccharide deacetylase n=1 Tax=Tropicimonas aquimaris TaxID=914152 RepID=A0ABW3IQQ2_9RHOB
MGQRKLAVLAFHKIGAPSDPNWPTWNYIPTNVFRRMLGVVDTSPWEPVDAARFRQGLDDPDNMPERALLITFDDGYLSTLTEATPCLQAFGFPAVVFVPTRYVGGTNSFDNGVEPEERMCGWADLVELARRGVEVQGHTVSHPHLSSLASDQQERELTESRDLLSERLGAVVDLLAYPYGDDDSARLSSDRLARMGYRAAFLYGGGIAPVPLKDPFRIPRFALGPDSDLAEMLKD